MNALMWINLAASAVLLLTAGWITTSSYKLGLKHGLERAARSQISAYNAVARNGQIPTPRLVVMNPNRDRN